MAARLRLLLVVLALALPGCGGDEEAGPVRFEAPQQEGTIEINGESATDRGSRAVTGPGAISVRAGEFYFEPTVLTGPAGTEVQLTPVLADQTPHNLSVPEQGIDQDLASGRPVGVRFPETGTLTFFCKYHRAQGMIGGLVVTSP